LTATEDDRFGRLERELREVRDCVDIGFALTGMALLLLFVRRIEKSSFVTPFFFLLPRVAIGIPPFDLTPIQLLVLVDPCVVSRRVMISPVGPTKTTFFALILE
jgi:hypothetical protein